jgi:hypothetical protein
MSVDPIAAQRVTAGVDCRVAGGNLTPRLSQNRA